MGHYHILAHDSFSFVQYPELNVYTQTIGKVTSSDKLIINDLIDIDRGLLHKAYYDSIEDIME